MSLVKKVLWGLRYSEDVLGSSFTEVSDKANEITLNPKRVHDNKELAVYFNIASRPAAGLVHCKSLR